MKKRLLIGALAAANIAMAATAGAAPNASNEAAADSAETPVCRRFTTLGSRVPKRICLTKMRWAEIDDDNKATAKRLTEATENTGHIGLPFDLNPATANAPVPH